MTVIITFLGLHRQKAVERKMHASNRFLHCSLELASDAMVRSSVSQKQWLLKMSSYYFKWKYPDLTAAVRCIVPLCWLLELSVEPAGHKIFPASQPPLAVKSLINRNILSPFKLNLSHTFPWTRGLLNLSTMKGKIFPKLQLPVTEEKRAIAITFFDCGNKLVCWLGRNRQQFIPLLHI